MTDRLQIKRNFNQWELGIHDVGHADVVTGRHELSLRSLFSH